MKRFIKYLSVALATLVLILSVGVSITNHICLAKKISSCSEDDSCCRNYHTSGFQSSKCCKVKSVYIKANFVSAGEYQTQKFFTEVTTNGLIVFSPFIPAAEQIETQCHAPPLLKSNRVILLSTSKLSV